MNKINKLWIFFIVKFLLLSSIYSQEYEHSHGQSMRGPYFFFGYHFMQNSSMQFSKDQIKSITNINIKYKDKFLVYHNKIHPLKKALKPLIAKENKTNSDYKKIHSILKKISIYEVELRLLKIKHRDEIFMVFTSEQKEKWRVNHQRGPREHGKPPF